MDADLVERLLVFGVDVAAEDQFGIGGAMQPAVFLDFGFKLSRSPSGIAQRKHRADGTVAASDRLQNVERRRETNAFVDWQCRILDKEVARMQDETATGLHRP